MTFKERLEASWKQGEFAYAFARLVVHNDVETFARLMPQSNFDITASYDEQHIEHQRKRK